jgi:hypothetical protein
MGFRAYLFNPEMVFECNYGSLQSPFQASHKFAPRQLASSPLNTLAKMSEMRNRMRENGVSVLIHQGTLAMPKSTF